MPRGPRGQQSIGVPGGFNLPVPRWTTQWFGVIAVLAIAFAVYRFFYPIEPELVTTQQANAMLRLEIGEYNKHILETAQATFEQPDIGLRIRFYEDGCLIVARKAINGAGSTRLLLDPNRDDAKRRSSLEDAKRLVSLLWPSAVLLAQGRCLNPHPGRFQWRYGRRADTCWVEVWRRFEDGCEHVQMFNACANSWATNPDGSPSVRWARCIH